MPEDVYEQGDNMKTIRLKAPERLFDQSDPKLVYAKYGGQKKETSVFRCAHTHDFMEILLFTEGEGQFTLNTASYPIHPGSIAICNRGSSHAENYDGCDAGFVVLGVTGIRFPELSRDCLIPDYFEPVLDLGERQQDYLCLFELIGSCEKKHSYYSGEGVRLLLKSFLLQLYEDASEANVKAMEKKLTQEWTLGNCAKTYINQHFMEELSVEQIASELNISASYLAHLFREEAGQTVMQYVTGLRIGEAQTLLCTTDRSLTEISHEVGYNSSNNFYITFKKHVGCAPREYRNQFREFQTQLKKRGTI